MIGLIKNLLYEYESEVKWKSNQGFITIQEEEEKLKRIKTALELLEG